MPKARTTCTRCSMRRQKCDRKQPCSRCVQADEARSCTRVWNGGYDARIHRAYPKGSVDHHGSVGSRSPAAWRPAARSPQKALEQQSIEACSTARQTPEPMVASGDGSNIASIQGLHPESNSLSQEEDVREFDYYARFRHNEISYLQNCLPNHLLLYQLVEYHEKSLLWHHNCIDGPTFRNEVMTVLHSAGNSNIQLKDLDLRWCALLFAVLSASITCATEKQATTWNLDGDQKQHNSKKWHEAAMECLVLGEFASKPHVYSVQTIQVLAMSALLLGLSNQQFVMFGTSLRMAQSLGLHRLSCESEGRAVGMTEASKTRNETGRRVWWNLVMQDWFSISSYDIFSIHPQHFTTSRPHSHVEAGTDQAEDEALTGYTNHILDNATVMVDFHTASIACTDAESKYEQVLKFDAKLRHLSSKIVPPNSANITWVPWARRTARVMNAHKVIILHRHFLSRSFRDAAFAYTRWASIEASKVIVREVERSFADQERPIIWNDQSHLTGAGVTLCLDAMHRNEEEPEHAEHLRLVEKIMAMLAVCKNSVLASRGQRLLSSMLRERTKDPAEKKVPDSRRGFPQTTGENETLSWPIENRETIDAMRVNGKPNEAAAAAQTGHPTPTSQRDLQSPNDGQQTARFSRVMSDPNVQPTSSGDVGAYGVDQFPLGATDDVLADASWTEMLSELFPDQLGFGNAFAFDDLFSTQFPT